MWNNRIIHHHDPKASPSFQDWYTIHEVFYHKDDTIRCWTEDSVAPFGNSLEELRSSYDMMVEAFDLPILEADELERTHRINNESATDQ